MTKFTGPLIVGRLDSDATAAVIDASGSAAFDGTVDVSGRVTFRANVQASSSATFQERIQVGNSGQRGTAIVAQRATLAAINSAGNPVKFLLPTGSDIIDYKLDLEIPLDSAIVTAQRIYTYNGSAAQAISEIGVSASGRYDLLGGTTPGGNSTALIRNVRNTVETFTSTKALASAATVGQGMLTIVYLVP